MFTNSRYWKKCQYANIADADINIGTPLHRIKVTELAKKFKQARYTK